MQYVQLETRNFGHHFSVTSCDSSDYRVFVDLLSSLCCLCGSDLLFLEDFNIPEFVSCLSGLTMSTQYNCLNHLINFFDLIQCNSIVNSSNKLLDLVLVNSQNKCLLSRAPKSYVKEDNHHPALDIEYQFPKTFLKSLSPVTHNHEFHFRKSNFHLLYASLCEINWSFLSQYRRSCF
jgi:hypothetical protein